MVTWGYRHDKTETSRCNRYRSLDLDWNIPICSMYGIFTNIWPNNITQLEANIPYIEHMGYWNLENILKLGSWPLYPEKNAENWPGHLKYIYIYIIVYIYIYMIYIIYIYISYIYIYIYWAGQFSAHIPISPGRACRWTEFQVLTKVRPTTQRGLAQWCPLYTV